MLEDAVKKIVAGKKFILRDTSSTKETLKAFLSGQAGVRAAAVTAVTTLKEAINIAKELVGDLGLVFCGMQDGDDPKELRELINVVNARNQGPVVLVASDADLTSFKKVGEGVFYQHLRKPFNAQEIEAEFRTALGPWIEKDYAAKEKSAIEAAVKGGAFPRAMMAAERRLKRTKSFEDSLFLAGVYGACREPFKQKEELRRCYEQKPHSEAALELLRLEMKTPENITQIQLYLADYLSSERIQESALDTLIQVIMDTKDYHSLELVVDKLLTSVGKLSANTVMLLTHVLIEVGSLPELSRDLRIQYLTMAEEFCGNEKESMLNIAKAYADMKEADSAKRVLLKIKEIIKK